MTAPKNQIIQMEWQNPEAKAPLFLPVLVICNTPDEEIQHNIRVNSARDLEWIKATPAHDGIAVMVGGGGSVSEFPDTIRDMQEGDGATVFAMNGASKWLTREHIAVDYQCILDARIEIPTLIDHEAKAHLFASQVNPVTMEAVKNPIVWHCNTGNIEQYFPAEKVARGGYVLLSGGSTCGTSSLSAAYALGFREFHIFGYDSCHQDGKSHVYSQPMNTFIPNVDVVWGERTFTASVAMRGQAEDFQIISQALKRLGCEFHLYGDGLLQTMYNTKPQNLAEREKYRHLWQFNSYRVYSPGLRAVPEFLARCNPGKDDIIIDFGCGSGKASVELHELGYRVFLIDFADNCRDEEAVGLPFLEWDLTRPIPPTAPYGFCCDVMEHIPPQNVDTVINNLMTATDTMFFQISTLHDVGAKMIDATLHLTVIPGDEWAEIFQRLGYEISWQMVSEFECQFVVTHKD